VKNDFDRPGRIHIIKYYYIPTERKLKVIRRQDNDTTTAIIMSYRSILYSFSSFPLFFLLPSYFNRSIPIGHSNNDSYPLQDILTNLHVCAARRFVP